MLSAFSRAFENKTSSHFDKVLAALEDVILSPEFDEIDTNFLDQHCHIFDDDRTGVAVLGSEPKLNSEASENKLEYTQIFKEYEKLGDETLTKGLNEKLGGDFNMNQFNEELVKYNKDGCLDEIQEMLKCFTDFLAFKEKILDYKKFKNGELDALDECLVISKGAGPIGAGLIEAGPTGAGPSTSSNQILNVELNFGKGDNLVSQSKSLEKIKNDASQNEMEIS